jgi:hypothetical protein
MHNRRALYTILIRRQRAEKRCSSLFKKEADASFTAFLRRLRTFVWLDAVSEIARVSLSWQTLFDYNGLIVGMVGWYALLFFSLPVSFDLH